MEDAVHSGFREENRNPSLPGGERDSSGEKGTEKMTEIVFVLDAVLPKMSMLRVIPLRL